MAVDQKYMKRCFELANQGLGLTYPNPLVGCVIVHNGRIIGEGWHRKAGEPHAEVLAIGSVADKNLLKEATLYVNLEPCSHFGRTPPCADLIVENRIKKVVLSNLDPNVKVSGRGIRRLRESGCEVITGVLENEGWELNRRFFTFHQAKRPYVILKWAQSADGYLFPVVEGTDQKGPVWISNMYSRQLVHRWRAEEQSILVGSNTVLQDDPSLTVREHAGNQMLRLVIDRTFRSGPKEGSDQLRSLYQYSEIKTAVFIDKDFKPDSAVLQKLTHVDFVEIDFEQPVVIQVLEYLWSSGVESLIVEGGTITLNSFIDSGLWDEARVFRGIPSFGGGVRAPILPEVAALTDQEAILEDQLKIYRNNNVN